MSDITTERSNLSQATYEFRSQPFFKPSMDSVAFVIQIDIEAQSAIFFRLYATNLLEPFLVKLRAAAFEVIVEVD